MSDRVRVRRKWRAKDNARLLALRESGLSFKAIGKRLKRGSDACQNKWYYLTGAYDFEKAWPPTSDPWTARVDYTGENMNLRERGAVRIERRGDPASLIGCAAAMCVG